MNPLYKLAIGAAAVLLLGLGVKYQYDRSIRKQEQQSARRDSLTNVVHVTDSIHVADTVRLHRQIAISDTIRRNLVLTDTVHVRRVLTQDSVTIQACVEAQSSCATTIAARDALIAELRKPIVTPRLSFFAEGLYDPLNRTGTARVGPEYRLWLGFSLRAEGEVSADPGGAYRGAIRVGVRKSF